MKRRMATLLLVSLLLSGCGFADGIYVSVTPHQEQKQIWYPTAITASNYLDMMDALVGMVASGTESATIHLTQYPAYAVESGMSVAIHNVMENDPVGSYAVDHITYEVGFRGGQPAVAVQIAYLHNRSEIRQIRKVSTMEDVRRIIENTLENYDSGVVMLVENYASWDLAQIVEDFAEENPDLVMEVPQVATGVYGSGRQRVLELSFAYQTSRDSLRQMKYQVKPVFDAAALYVSADASHWQKYSQLYGFLMERFDYSIATSITPAYSLLHHGVGDSRAFARVFAAMCTDAGLECQIVKGTRSGEPWSWNLVCDNGYYYHVDLLRCNEAGRYQQKTDAQMQDYVWDYSAYPPCTGKQQQPEYTQPQPQPQEETEPSDEATEATISEETKIFEENEK